MNLMENSPIQKTLKYNFVWNLLFGLLYMPITAMPNSSIFTTLKELIDNHQIIKHYGIEFVNLFQNIIFI